MPPPITSAGTKQIKMSKSERDRLDKLATLLAGTNFRYGSASMPYHTEPEDVRAAQRSAEQLVRRYDKAKS